MMKKLRLSKKAVAVTAVAALFLGGGAAFAYWTFGGAGTGSAVVAANPASALVVIGATPPATLAPGEQVALTGSITNPNNTDVKVGLLTAVVTSVSKGATAADFTITGGPVAVNAIVKKGTPVAWTGLTLKYANSAVNQDNGKSATVTITYTAAAFVEAVVPAGPASIVGTTLTLDYNGVAEGFNGIPLNLMLKDVNTGVTSGWLASTSNGVLHYSANPGTPAIVLGHVYDVMMTRPDFGGIAVATYVITAI